MRGTAARTALLFASVAMLLPLLSGCAGECGGGEEGSEIPLESGTYRSALTGGGGHGGSYEATPSNFPHNGHDVSVQVDRAAGLVTASWTNDAGESVVEVWEIAE